MKKETEKFYTTNGNLAEMLDFQRFTASPEEETEIVEQARLLYDNNIGTADADLFISQEMDRLAGYHITARDVVSGNIFEFVVYDLSEIDFA